VFLALFVIFIMLVLVASGTRWATLRKGRKRTALVAVAIWFACALVPVMFANDDIEFTVLYVVAVTAALGLAFAAALAIPNGVNKKSFALGAVLCAAAGAALFIVIVSFATRNDYLPRHKVAEVVLTLDLVRREITTFYSEHQRLPKDAAEAKLNLAPVSRYVGLVTYDGATEELRAVIKGITDNEGKSLVFKAEPSGKELKWTCFSRDIASRDLPATCRAK